MQLVELEWIKWDCPECDEEHEDYEGTLTSCRKCGLVVIAYDGYAVSQEWKVEVENDLAQSHPLASI